MADKHVMLDGTLQWVKLFSPEYNKWKKKEIWSTEVLLGGDPQAALAPIFDAVKEIYPGDPKDLWRYIYTPDTVDSKAFAHHGDTRRTKAGDPVESYKGKIYCRFWNDVEPIIVTEAGKVAERSRYSANGFREVIKSGDKARVLLSVSCFKNKEMGNWVLSTRLLGVRRLEAGEGYGGGEISDAEVASLLGGAIEEKSSDLEALLGGDVPF